MEKLLTIEELSAVTGLSRGALAQMRYLGTGPQFVKFGRQVRYPRVAVEDFVRSHTVLSTSKRA